MADAVQSLNRNRTIFIFAVGLIVLVGIFLGGLFLSGQRGDELQRLASTDKFETKETKKEENTQPKAAPKEQGRNNEKKETPPKKEERSNAPQSGTAEKKETPPPAKPTPAPSQPEEHVSSNKPIPATGPEISLIAVPILLVVVYVAYEYRRSRQAVERAAFHENSAF